MSVEAVRAHLARYGLSERIVVCETSSATVELAAAVVGCEPARIVKTLSFEAGDRCVLVAASGDARVDNAKYKARFGVKAKMLKPDEAPQRTGHAVGGVCPFAVKDGVEVYLDESIRRFDWVYPAAGASDAVARLTVSELERASGGTWVDVCK